MIILGDLSVFFTTPQDSNIAQAVFGGSDSGWPAHELADWSADSRSMAVVAVVTTPTQCSLLGAVALRASVHHIAVKHISVLPAYRRFGVAKMLLDITVRQARAIGCAVSAFVDPDNKAAVRLCASCGFKAISVIPACGRIRERYLFYKGRFDEGDVSDPGSGVDSAPELDSFRTACDGPADAGDAGECLGK